MHNIDSFLVADTVPEPVTGGHNKGVLVIQISGGDLGLGSEASCPFQVMIPETPVLALYT